MAAMESYLTDRWSSVKFVNISPVNKLRYKVVEFGGATSSLIVGL